MLEGFRKLCEDIIKDSLEYYESEAHQYTPAVYEKAKEEGNKATSPASVSVPKLKLTPKAIKANPKVSPVPPPFLPKYFRCPYPYYS